MSNNVNIIDKIKLLTVKIMLSFDTKQETGTGIIIRLEESDYILTVKHVIFGKDSQYKTEINNIKVVLHDETSIGVNSIDEFHELILLKINTCTFDVPKVEYLDKAIYDKEYFLRGFPKAMPNGDSFPFNEVKCDDINTQNQSLALRINNINGDSSPDDTIDKMQGMSGSGVFFEEYGKLYLVGVVNSLIDKHGTFCTVNAYTLVKLLMKENVKLCVYRKIEDITEEMKKDNKKITTEGLEEFKMTNNIHFNNLNRKNNTIYDSEDATQKNYIRISEYINGNKLINDISELDINFKEKWKTIQVIILDSFYSKYTNSIEDKTIGQSRIIEMTGEVKESLKEEFSYLNLNVGLLNNLTSNVIAKWLLDCNVDFILKD